MSDNTTLNTGSGGDVIATDDISGVKFQRVKLTLGADGANDGDVSFANPVPVSGPLTNTQLRAAEVPVSIAALPLATGAASSAIQTTQQTALDLLNATVGDKADATAATEQGTYSLMAFVKRLMNKLPGSVGQTSKGLSLSVALASDQFGLEDLTVNTGSGSLSINSELLTGSSNGVDALGYRSVSVQIMPASGTVTAGVITFEETNDRVTWSPCPMYDRASLTANPVTTVTLAAATNRFMAGSIMLRYFRVRISTGVTGTTTGIFAIGKLSAATYNPPQQTVTQATGANLNVGTVSTITSVTSVVSSTPVTPTSTFTNSAASTNATNTKASAGTMWSVICSNSNAAVRYLKLYNKASAPTVGTDVPVMTIPLPVGGMPAQIDGGSNGVRFSLGISWALTTGVADSDTGAVSAAEHKVAITFT